MPAINIQFTLFSAFYTPLIVTMSGGFLKREGIDYAWSVSEPGRSAVESIVNGSADVIQSAPSQGFNSLAAGQEPVAVHFAQINEMDGFFLSGRQADADFDWHRLEDAEVVMFKAGQPSAMFRYACHRAGIDYARIKRITPGGAADIDRAFRAGQGQYVQQQGPFPQQLEHDDSGHVVAAVGPQIGPCAFSSLAASRAWLKTDEAAAFTRAYRAARRFINDEDAATVTDAVQAFFPDTDPAALRRCIASYQSLGCWTPHIEITRPAFEVTLDVYEFIGGIAEHYDYDRVCCAPPG